MGRAEEAFGHGVLTLREARGGQRLLLSTLHEEEYEFVSPSSVAIAELVAVFLEGLKERSVFAMALEDQKATGAWARCGWWGQPCGMGRAQGLERRVERGPRDPEG